MADYGRPWQIVASYSRLWQAIADEKLAGLLFAAAMFAISYEDIAMGRAETAAEAAQSFAYEIREGSAVIWRCFSLDAKAEIPEQLDGYPVTALAPYAFSEHMEEQKLQEGFRSGRIRRYVPEVLREHGRESGGEFDRGQDGTRKKADEILRDAGETSQQMDVIWQGAAGMQQEINRMQRDAAGIRQEINRIQPDMAEMSQQLDETRQDIPAAAQSMGRISDVLCGNRLEEIVLPPTLRRVGRYCFYNCEKLHKITFYGQMSDWGSGVFTGCHQVRHLCVHTDAAGRSHLKDVLDELREELYIEYFYPGGQACLVFPEFYEEGVENTPARILETHVHGSGLFYRNCFQDRKFDFAQYDVLFPYARAQERPELAAQMVQARLCYPQGLTARAKQQYETYVADHAREMAAYVLRQRDIKSLRWLLDILEQSTSFPKQGRESSERSREFSEWSRESSERSRESSERRKEFSEQNMESYDSLLEYMMEYAAGLRDAEAVSYLMERRRARGRGYARRKRMEL